MKLLAGVNFTKSGIFFSFASRKGKKVIPCGEYLCEKKLNVNSIEKLVKDNIDYIDRELTKKEKKDNCKISDVYCAVSDDCIRKQVVEDTVSLNLKKNRKKISPKDIIQAKKHIEQVSLEWDDFLLHHIVLEYDVDGKKYNFAPVGVWARKLKIKSLLVYVKNIYKEEVFNCFDSFNRVFSGFIYEPVAILTAGYNGVDKKVIAIDIGTVSTSVVSFFNEDYFFEKKFDFGEETVIKAVADKFLLTEDVAKQLIFQYASFHESSHEKEISLRNNDEYINVSSKSLNLVLRDVFYAGLSLILKNLHEAFNVETIPVFFTGRVTWLDGFTSFVKNSFSVEIKKSGFYKNLSLGFGCVKYGQLKYFEQLPEKESFLKKIYSIYKEYF